MSLLDARKRDDILKRIANLQPEAKGQWGKMNCHQAVCHLTDQFRGMFGESETTHLNSFMKKTVVKWLALYVISVPKNIPTLPEFDQDKKGTQPTEFENDRAILIAYIEKFVDAPEDFKWNAHGAFGKLNRNEWNRLAYKHIDHHLRQFGA
jgi:hypothetical protein